MNKLWNWLHTLWGKLTLSGTILLALSQPVYIATDSIIASKKFAEVVPSVLGSGESSWVPKRFQLVNDVYVDVLATKSGNMFGVVYPDPYKLWGVITINRIPEIYIIGIDEAKQQAYMISKKGDVVWFKNEYE